MADYMLAHISVNRNILDDPRYAYLFSVESVNRLVLEGTPFRDAYKAVGMQIEAGEYHPEKAVHHTHEGSIGNLCNKQIAGLMADVLAEFDFDRVRQAERELSE
jgi:argininosuccinate lyase